VAVECADWFGLSCQFFYDGAGSAGGSAICGSPFGLRGLPPEYSRRAVGLGPSKSATGDLAAGSDSVGDQSLAAPAAPSSRRRVATRSGGPSPPPARIRRRRPRPPALLPDSSRPLFFRLPPSTPCAVVLKPGLHASPILLESQVRSVCGSIRKHAHFARICG